MQLELILTSLYRSECYDQTDSSCPKGTLYNDLNLSEIEVQLTTSLTVLGAWFGSLYGNRPAQLYGRKKTLLFNCSFFLVGTALSSAIGDVYSLLIGRVSSLPCSRSLARSLASLPDSL
jgi:MFS family permease